MGQRKVGAKYTAVLLVAGQGTRIEEVTNRPKCLLPINGESILERNFRIWKDLGIKDVNLVVGYQAKKILLACEGLSKDFNINVFNNDDYIIKGNSFSLFQGIEKVNGPTLIFDGDLVYDKHVLEEFLKDQNENQILVGPGQLADIECAKVLIDDDQYVRMTIDKRAVSAQELEQYQFVGEAIGILKFSQNLTTMLSKTASIFLSKQENMHLNWEHLLNIFLEKNKVSFHEIKSGRWIEIDTAQDYRHAIELFKD